MLSVIISIVTYFIIGIIIFHIYGNGKYKYVKLYSFVFLVSTVFCLLYYNVWILLGLEAYGGIEGLFSPDSSTYYLDAVAIKNSNFSAEVIRRVVTDHYHQIFLAIQLAIFGEHVLVPKIYQVLLFSISVVLWVSIARDILKNSKAVKYYFYLMVFCVPLLTYNAFALKEISLLLSTTVAIYGFSKYQYKSGRQFRYLCISLLGIFFMFMFRRQFALIMVFSLFLGTFLGSGLSLKKKIIWGIASIAGVTLILFLPVLEEIGALTALTEGGNIFVGRGDTGRISAARAGLQTHPEYRGLLGNAMIIVLNPILVMPMFIYGVIQLFFHPPFVYTPNVMMLRGDLSYLTMGYYNILFNLLLPAFYFGARYLHKKLKRNPVIIAILIYFLINSLSIIYSTDSYRRFKISYFWPIVYIYICYGIVMYNLWKKYIPLVVLAFICLIASYYIFDFINFISIYN